MHVHIHVGDALHTLQGFADQSFHCVVTSPPYWSLRDYETPGQLGSEPTPEDHITALVDVFREVRRVLRDDGTVWLNYGDTYSVRRRGGSARAPDNTLQKTNAGSVDWGTMARCALPPKNLLFLNARIAMALQADGWIVRSEIVWNKPNGMPESVLDRPTASHEKIYLMTKTPRYYYDARAVRTPPKQSTVERATRPRKSKYRVPGTKPHNGAIFKERPRRGHTRTHNGFDKKWDLMTKAEQQANGANLRNVWTVAVSNYQGAHFATFPPDLIVPCIKAGCPEDGTVLDPFAGAGTTGLVAARLGRNADLVEINPDYAKIAKARLEADGLPLLTRVAIFQ